MIARRLTLAAGAALIVAANLVALGGVAYNRSGEPEARMVLSERELIRPWSWRANKENSGLALRLDWRVIDPNVDSRFAYYGSVNGGMPGWLDERRMAELGFDVASLKAGAGPYRKRRGDAEREVLVVLELGGGAWQEAVERARRQLDHDASLLQASPADKGLIEAEKRAREQLAREENSNSRLFAVDVGSDLAALRAKYPDRGRFLVLKGKLRPQVTTRDKQTIVTGYVGPLTAGEINVPHAMRPAFDAMPVATGAPPGKKAPFTATVAVGQRLEPWLEAVGVR